LNNFLAIHQIGSGCLRLLCSLYPWLELKLSLQIFHRHYWIHLLLTLNWFNRAFFFTAWNFIRELDVSGLIIYLEWLQDLLRYYAMLLQQVKNIGISDPVAAPWKIFSRIPEALLVCHPGCPSSVELVFLSELALCFDAQPLLQLCVIQLTLVQSLWSLVERFGFQIATDGNLTWLVSHEWALSAHFCFWDLCIEALQGWFLHLLFKSFYLLNLHHCFANRRSHGLLRVTSLCQRVNFSVRNMGLQKGELVDIELQFCCLSQVTRTGLLRDRTFIFISQHFVRQLTDPDQILVWASLWIVASFGDRHECFPVDDPEWWLNFWLLKLDRNQIIERNTLRGAFFLLWLLLLRKWMFPKGHDLSQSNPCKLALRRLAARRWKLNFVSLQRLEQLKLVQVAKQAVFIGCYPVIRPLDLLTKLALERLGDLVVFNLGIS
jgi:hypothetical protein